MATGSFRSLVFSGIIGCSLLFGAIPVLAITIQPPYDSTYTFADLGAVPNLPTPYGGLTLEYNDTNTLLIGGLANSAGGNIYSIGVTRDVDGHINGFSGNATFFAEGPNNDGGVTYGPGNILFVTTYSNNHLLQIKPGETTVAKDINLSDEGVCSSVGSIGFVPFGFGGAGRAKILSYTCGIWYDATVTPDGFGTYNITLSGTSVTISGVDPEGVAYVPSGSANFTNPSVLVALYNSGKIVTFEVDSNGDPVTSTEQDFMTDLTGAEGAFIDPVTGDFVFSTFGAANHVVVVRGFSAPVPEIPNISVNDVSQNEGNSGTTSFDFTITRSGNTGNASSVDFATFDGTASVADSDYATNSGTVNFAANETTKTVSILVNGDTNVEPNETFEVNLSNCVGCNLSDDQGVGTILNDEAGPLPDADADGVPDAIDQCPTVPGPASNAGCPIITEQPVGGEILGIDMTSLFVAGAFANAGWIIPIAGVTAAGIVGFALRKRINTQKE